MKKIFAATLAAVMTVSLTSVAFAATEEKGFVLGYKEGIAPGTGTTVYADQDDDGNYDETTLEALGTLEGVASVKADLEGKCATVTLTGAVSDQSLTDAVTEAGYEVVSIQ